MLTQWKRRAGSPDRIGRILLLLPVLLALSAVFAACAKSPDRRAYDEVAATMSLHKAKQFFERYPRSPYRDRLVDDIIEWCRREETPECWRMARDVVPADHPRYGEVTSECARHSGGRGG